MAEPMASLQTTRGWLRHAGRYWLPPLLWMAVMFGLSTDTFAAEHTGGVLWHVVRVAAHERNPSGPQTSLDSAHIGCK
jgi:hypothetical protein